MPCTSYGEKLLHLRVWNSTTIHIQAGKAKLYVLDSKNKYYKNLYEIGSISLQPQQYLKKEY